MSTLARLEACNLSRSEVVTGDLRDNDLITPHPIGGMIYRHCALKGYVCAIGRYGLTAFTVERISLTSKPERKTIAGVDHEYDKQVLSLTMTAINILEYEFVLNETIEVSEEKYHDILDGFKHNIFISGLNTGTIEKQAILYEYLNDGQCEA